MPPEEDKRTGSGAGELILLVPVILLGALVYQPWALTPFPIADWGGLLSHFQGHDAFGSRYRALMDAYTQDGRYFPGVAASWALRWTMLGDHPVSWQLARFGLMTANIVAAFVFLRRVGCGAVASAASLVLFVVSAMVMQSWVLLQLPEPDGLLFVLLACILATGYQRTAHPIPHAVALAGSLVAAIFMKETYVIAVPFVLALAACVAGPGDYRLPSVSRRNLGLVVGTAAAVLALNVRPVLQTRAGAHGDSYAGRYSLDTLTLDHVGNVFASMFLPVTRAPWFPANVAFVAILIGGLVLAVSAGRGPARFVPYVIALSLPLMGALLYLPWPTIEGYYGTGVLPGLTLLFALALTWIGGAGSAMRLVTGAAIALIVVYGAVFTSSFVAMHRAAREVEAATALMLRGYPNAREFIVGVPAPAPTGPFADGLRRYAVARGARNLPPGREVSCDEAARLIEAAPPRTLVVAFVPGCPAQAFKGVRQQRTIRRTYVTRDWKTLRSRGSESLAHVWAGE